MLPFRNAGIARISYDSGRSDRIANVLLQRRCTEVVSPELGCSDRGGAVPHLCILDCI
jgi:hypothetical protein